jgi:hypothetical protein
MGSIPSLIGDRKVTDRVTRGFSALRKPFVVLQHLPTAFANNLLVKKISSVCPVTKKQKNPFYILLNIVLR